MPFFTLNRNSVDFITTHPLFFYLASYTLTWFHASGCAIWRGSKCTWVSGVVAGEVAKAGHSLSSNYSRSQSIWRISIVSQYSARMKRSLHSPLPQGHAIWKEMCLIALASCAAGIHLLLSAMLIFVFIPSYRTLASWIAASVCSELIPGCSCLFAASSSCTRSLHIGKFANFQLYNVSGFYS